MDDDLKRIKSHIYDKCKMVFVDFEYEEESKDYKAARFNLNENSIVYRHSKVTPKKAGQFVTFWKRNKQGVIEPLDNNDQFDFFVVTVRSDKKLGQFVFPKSILVEKGLITTNEIEGKRAFRVYPDWDIVQSNQAIKTQKWQLNYFYKVCDELDLNKVKQMYNLY